MFFYFTTYLFIFQIINIHTYFELIITSIFYILNNLPLNYHSFLNHFLFIISIHKIEILCTLYPTKKTLLYYYLLDFIYPLCDWFWF